MNGEVAVILRYSTEFASFGANYVKLVAEHTPILSATICSPKNIVFKAIYDLWRYSQELPRTIEGPACQRR